ncbi:Translocon-associated protein, delta subunit [Teladorsagia circumcincta]|uniref:Translocon-associated protein subunit delta n=1 Tax=Teladorsagia circumcincta TaxID=45464 RepID=A0A2G9UC98_TELCI|nr:Translocon-associated protein, delta subunit [Teladorsagia circumcincta]
MFGRIFKKHCFLDSESRIKISESDSEQIRFDGVAPSLLKDVKCTNRSILILSVRRSSRSDHKADSPFFAVINGHIYNVAVSVETAKYQISWTQEHEQSDAQQISIKIFDEEGIAAYRKDSNTSPLFTIEHYHAGLTRKPFVSSETVALLVCLAALYYAIKQKSEITH